jgi:pimeloyl-ACP methyl ester carboxylesterase
MPISAGIHYLFHDGGSPQKPPLVLIHGVACCCLSWPPEIRRLAAGRVFTIDLPGHGKSSGPCFQTVNEYAECLVRFLDAAGIWQAVVVGHSLGAAIALILSIDHPERVAGLGLISAGASLPVAAQILENAATSTTFIKAVRSFQGLMNIPQNTGNINDRVFKDLSSVRPTLLHGDLLACDQFKLDVRLSSIHVPVLVICGTNDQFTPPRYSKYLATRIPGASLQTIDEAGHMVMLEQLRRLSALLSVFLKIISPLQSKVLSNRI